MELENNTKKCIHCKEEFTPKRSDAKYCSISCKTITNNAKKRNKTIMEFQDQLSVSTTKTPVNRELNGYYSNNPIKSEQKNTLSEYYMDNNGKEEHVYSDNSIEQESNIVEHVFSEEHINEYPIVHTKKTKSKKKKKKHKNKSLKEHAKIKAENIQVNRVQTLNKPKVQKTSAIQVKDKNKASESNITSKLLVIGVGVLGYYLGRTLNNSRKR